MAGEGRGGSDLVVPFALLVGAVYLIGLPAAGFFDNEGRFAEVARQMTLRGDWVTPYLNDVPILTKPPLTQWFAAGFFLVFGPSEWARVVSVGASVLTLVAACRLGTLLFDRTVGLVTGLVLATMVGFVLEARTLRPDAILVACSSWAILCWWRAEHEPGPRRTRWLVGFWVALGLGMLAKGFVPFVVVGPPVALGMVPRHGLLASVRRLRPGLGAAILLGLVLPWHVEAARRNPGFAWDYVVNQHLLFAFDKKEPRDSEGDSLIFFWLAFAFRTAPWGLLAPAALHKRPLVGSAASPSATGVLWAWALGHALVFSLTPSRLEHYTLPAHPAVAMLAATSVVSFVRGGVGSAVPRGAVVALTVVLASAGVGLSIFGRSMLSNEYWIPQAPGMLDLVPVTGALLALGGGTALVMIGFGFRRGAVAAVALVAAGLGGACARALVIATPLFSWQPVAQAIRAEGLRSEEIVFEAPVEYQLVGGLDYYLGRSVTLLEPALGFVPPTYLEGRTVGMFAPREVFATRWKSSERIVFVTDPQLRRDQPDGIVPPPFRPIARFGDRWVLVNAAAD